MGTSMDDLIGGSQRHYLLDINLSSLSDNDSASHSHSDQPQYWESVAHPRLTRFASEECFDRILSHLVPTPEDFQNTQPYFATISCTEKKLDSTTLFAICGLLHHAIIGSLDVPLATSNRAARSAGSEWSVDPRILPRVLRCVRPWRLADPWARSDRSSREDHGELARLDAVDLATALASLANDLLADYEEAPHKARPVRPGIKWLGQEDTQEIIVGPVYDNPVPCHVSPPLSAELRPEVEIDSSDMRPGNSEASLFRSGCLACRRPRSTLCAQVCDETQQPKTLATNARLLNADSKSRRSTSHALPPHPGNKNRTHDDRTAVSESVTTKPKPNTRSRSVRTRETESKENAPPMIIQPHLSLRHQGSPNSRDKTIPSVTILHSFAHTSSFSNPDSCGSPRLASSLSQPYNGSDTESISTTAHRMVKRNSPSPTPRPHSTMRSRIRKEEYDPKRPTQSRNPRQKAEIPDTRSLPNAKQNTSILGQWNC